MCKFFLQILLFIYIFDMPINIGGRVLYGSILVGFFCISLMIYNKRYAREFFSLFMGRYHRRILLFIFLIMFYSASMSILHGTKDFSYLRLCIHMAFNIEVGVLVFALIKVYKRETCLLNYVINVFIIQSVIQVISYISPTFKSITNVFRSPTQLEYAKLYEGYRGLGLAGSGFFGLAVVYGFVFVLIAFYWKEWKIKSMFFRILCMCLLLVGSISAGRSALFGLAFAFLFLLGLRFIHGSYRSLFTRNSLKTLLVVVLVITIGLIAYTKLADSKNQSLREFHYYFSTFIEGLFNGKGLLSSTSGQSLFSSFQYRLTMEQIMFGDGRYRGINGAVNYMHQDSGFMRDILQFGLGGLILLFCTQYSIWKPCIKKRFGNKSLFAVIICLMATVFHFKGEVVGISIEFQSLSLLVCYALAQNKRYASLESIKT